MHRCWHAALPNQSVTHSSPVSQDCVLEHATPSPATHWPAELQVSGAVQVPQELPQLSVPHCWLPQLPLVHGPQTPSVALHSERNGIVHGSSQAPVPHWLLFVHCETQMSLPFGDVAQHPWLHVSAPLQQW